MVVLRDVGPPRTPRRGVTFKLRRERRDSPSLRVRIRPGDSITRHGAVICQTARAPIP